MNTTETPSGSSLDPHGSVAITGAIMFYHGGKRGRPIRIGCYSDSHREELLQKLCADPEVEGFEIEWDKPQNAADHRSGAGGVKYGTEAPSPGSVHLLR